MQMKINELVESKNRTEKETEEKLKQIEEERAKIDEEYRAKLKEMEESYSKKYEEFKQKMYLDKLKQRFETQQHNEILQQKLKKQDSDNAKKRLERLLDLYLAEDIDIETYKTKKAEIDKEIDLLENQIANFDNNIEEVHISQKYLLEV